MAETTNTLEACLAETMEATGWSREEAMINIITCRQRLGIEFDDYCMMRMYTIAPENQAARYEHFLQKRERERRERKKCISAVALDLGCSKEKAIRKIEACRNALGVSYRDYLKLELWKLNRHDRKVRYRRYLHTRREAKIARESCVNAAVAAMGWTQEEALEKIRFCRRKYGIPYRDYLELELWSKDDGEQQRLFAALTEKRSAEAQNSIPLDEDSFFESEADDFLGEEKDDLPADEEDDMNSSEN